MRAGKIIVVTLLVVAVLLAPAVTRSLRWGTNFEGLTVLATSRIDEYSANPFAANFYLVTPGMARWLLLNTDYPYAPCVASEIFDCSMPRAYLVVASLGTGNAQTDAFGYELLARLNEKDVDLDAYAADGLTALHAAILFSQPKTVAWLLKAGADAHRRIGADGISAGLDAVEFATLLHDRDAEKYAGVYQMLTAPVPDEVVTGN